MRFLTVILIISNFLLSCSGKEGCNVPYAKNFDPEADKNCCCEYYKLRFDMQHVIDSFNAPFRLFDFYQDASSDAFQVKSISMLISNVSLVKNDGSEYFVEDSLLLPKITGSSAWFRDDFTILRPETFINNIGSFTDLDDYVKIRFIIGNLNSVIDGSSVNSSHPLSLNSGFYDSENSDYRSARFQIIKNISDTVQYYLKDTVWVELDYNISAIDGTDSKIPLSLNYVKLFENISFITDDSSQIVQKFKNNTKNAFFIQ